MTVTIVESGMSFGPYATDDCFQVEQSALYARIKTNVPMVEFAILRRQRVHGESVWLIEAKSSAPKPGNKIDFKKYVEEIHLKIVNALQVLFACWLTRHPEAAGELPVNFLANRVSALPIKCVLVIHGHEKSWLSPIQEALQTSLSAAVKTLGLSSNDVVVINHEMAKNFGLIQ